MHKMLMSVVVAAALIQGCTTVSDSMPTAASKQSTGYVAASKGDYVRATGGDCLRSIGWSSDNMVVECQAASKTADVAAPQLARLSYNGTALFEFDSAQLTSLGRAELNKLVNKMNSHKGIGEVKVEGHADSIGEEQYNQNLSERRAATVRSYLKSALNGVRVSASGMGESAPIADNATAEGRRENRRVEVKVDAKVAQ